MTKLKIFRAEDRDEKFEQSINDWFDENEKNPKFKVTDKLMSVTATSRGIQKVGSYVVIAVFYQEN